MSKSEPKYVIEALKWCNERRAETGKKALKRLPKGTRRDDPDSCPCGKATGLTVTLENYWVGDGPIEDTPDPVQKFVYAFDGGVLPQYEEAQ